MNCTFNNKISLDYLSSNHKLIQVDKEKSKDETIEHIWYSRPVFFVSDIHNSISFYVDNLGFIKKWHEADGKGAVCQVDRGGCEIILCQDTARTDKSRVFLELSRAGVDQLRKEFADRLVPTKKSWWDMTYFKLTTRTATNCLFV